MDAEKVLAALIDRQTAKAIEGCMKPRDKTEFGYGELSGYVQAMEDAKQIFLGALKDADELPRRRIG